MKVIKRNGKKVEFNKLKIETAILKAMESVGNVSNYNAVKISSYIEGVAATKGVISIEEIQDLVEVGLMSHKMYDVAKAYITYRYEHFKDRNLDNKILGLLDKTDKETLTLNANMDGYKLHSQRALIADVVLRDFGERRCLSENLKNEVENNRIYIHDMNYLPLPFFNCMLINWRDMFENGFDIAGTKINTPQSITTAMALLSQIIAHVSSNCYGGLTLDKLSTGLVPYVRKSFIKHYKKGLKWIAGLTDEEINNIDYTNIRLNNFEGSKVWDYAREMTIKEVYDATQGFEYEIATLTNARGEVPFITITLDTYSSTEEEVRLVTRAILETRKKGFTDGTTPVFPKILFFTKRGMNLDPQDPNYDLFKLACETTALRMYPDFLNYDKLVEITGSAKGSMGCRSFLPKYLNSQGEEVNDSRFNQGVCTINLTRLALESDKDETKFYELLDKALLDATEALMYRHNMLKKVKASQAPILYMSGAVSRLNADDSIEPLLKNGFSTLSIGYLGLSNAMVALYGEKHFANEETVEKARNILKYMKNYCDKIKEETSLGFSLYGTPSETLATKACKADLELFGEIEGVTDKGYYENSFHVDAEHEISPFEKITVESKFNEISSGGAIQYVQFGSLVKNPKVVEDIIRFSYDKCHYIGINNTPDKCRVCNFEGEILPTSDTDNKFKCPNCGNEDGTKMSVIRRISGYLGSLSERGTASGKIREINNRVKHIKE